jgi:hypothetical protein
MVTNSEGSPLELGDPALGRASLPNVAVDVDNTLRLANGYICTKVTVSFPMFDLFLYSRITPECRFHLTYSCTYLELFLRGQSMQVYDLAKYKWPLFTEQKWVEFTH